MTESYMKNDFMDVINNDPILYASYQVGKISQFILEEGEDFSNKQQLTAWNHILDLLIKREQHDG